MHARLLRLVTHPALAVAATLLAGLIECWALLRAQALRRPRS